MAVSQEKMYRLTDFLLALTSGLYLFICPYTKVEESFNLQAMHDLLYHGNNISEYDHLEFPGVVPRSFLGPVVVAFLSYPFFVLAAVLNLNKFFMQYVVRAVLGLLVVLAFEKFRSAVRKIFGNHVAIWLQLVSSTQFHFVFYSTRPLPNTFALILVLLAYSAWLEKDERSFSFFSAAAVVIFRGELCILLGLIVLRELIINKRGILPFFLWGVLFGFCSLGLTVVVDSYFWRRLLWPEGEVLWFNLYLNKSSEWGTSPWPWYFYSALPRALLLSIFLVPYSCWFDRRVRVLLFPAVGFIAIYSFLPHKELRFIIYTIPLFNVAAARTLDILWSNRLKSSKRSMVYYLSCFGLLTNFMVAILMVNISYYNYPGGFAMAELHEIESGNSEVSVHIDTYAAQTGVSRFTELNQNWKYSKAENLSQDGMEMMQFTHLIREWPDSDNVHLPYASSHVVISFIYTYSHCSIDIFEFPFFGMYMKRKVMVLKRLHPYPSLIVEPPQFRALQM